MNLRKATELLSVACAFVYASVAMALSEEEAIQRTKMQPCRGNSTVEQALDRTIKSHSQRDLGWRSFPGNGFVDVERAVLINKGMELRFRWRVEPQGTVGPENERAERLCESE
jgi:hypothetical protein